MDNYIIREIKYRELEELLELYKHLNADDPNLELDEEIRLLWDEIYGNPNLNYLVCELDGKIVASCTVAIIKNLTRKARPYCLVDNMITHSDYRKRGLGRAVLDQAVEIAKENNCYKVMVMSGSNKDETVRFYENAGFDSNRKTAFYLGLK